MGKNAALTKRREGKGALTAVPATKGRPKGRVRKLPQRLSRDSEKAGMLRLANFVREWMDQNKFSIYDIMRESKANGFDPPIHFSTVWRICEARPLNVDALTLEKLAAGMPGVNLHTLQRTLLGNPEGAQDVRPVEFSDELWTKLEAEAALHNRDWLGELRQIVGLYFDQASEIDQRKLFRSK